MEDEDEPVTMRREGCGRQITGVGSLTLAIHMPAATKQNATYSLLAWNRKDLLSLFFVSKQLGLFGWRWIRESWAWAWACGQAK